MNRLLIAFLLLSSVAWAGGPDEQVAKQREVDAAVASVTSALAGKVTSTFGTLGQVGYYEWVAVASGAAIPLESVIGTKTSYRGTLFFTILSGGQLSAAAFQIKGDINAAVELYDPDNAYTNATGGNTLNIIPDGDGTYTLQNCIAAGTYLEIQYLGWR